MPAAPVHKTAIRSYVRREGRITKAQSRALAELWPLYGVDNDDGPLDFSELYARKLPVIVEVGFGDGVALATMAADNPHCNFLGIEVYRPGVGSLLLKLKELGISNVRVIMDDAVEVMRRRIAPESLAKILIFYPDPWPKKRHHKRRLIQTAFLDSAIKCLEPAGHLHVTTDWEDYAEQILETFEREPRLRNTRSGFAERPAYRPLTKYERRAQDHGHGVWDIIFQRIA